MMTQTHSGEVHKLIGSDNSARNWLSNAKYLGILAGLLALGFLGHTTHWNFFAAHGSHGSGDPTEVQKPVADQPSVERWEVNFPSESSLEKSGVLTSPLDCRSIRERIKAVGVISYDQRRTASLSTRTSGTIWRVLKHVGDSVRRGDVLAIIDAAEVGRAKAEFLSELVIVETSAEILKSLEAVTDVVTLRKVREARVAVREATIRLRNAEQKLVNLGLSVQLQDFEKLNDAERSAKLHLLGLPESITQDLDIKQTTSNLLSLRAPFDGTVIKHDLALGETAEEGKPIIEMSDLSRMWLKLDVPKEDAARLALGQRVRFVPDGLEQQLESEIKWIASEVDLQTRTLQVRAEVDNPVISSDAATGREVRQLRANTFGSGSIVVDEVDNAFVVPFPVVLHSDDQPLIFVKTGERSFARLDVKTGIRDANLIQIKSPELKPGMEIVTQGCHMLKSESILNSLGSSSP